MRSRTTIDKRETRDLANRPAPVSLALLALLAASITAGCATTPTEPTVDDCVAMTEEELKQPIHIERFHIIAVKKNQFQALTGSLEILKISALHRGGPLAKLHPLRAVLKLLGSS